MSSSLKRLFGCLNPDVRGQAEARTIEVDGNSANEVSPGEARKGFASPDRVTPASPDRARLQQTHVLKLGPYATQSLGTVVSSLRLSEEGTRSTRVSDILLPECDAVLFRVLTPELLQPGVLKLSMPSMVPVLKVVKTTSAVGSEHDRERELGLTLGGNGPELAELINQAVIETLLDRASQTQSLTWSAPFPWMMSQVGSHISAMSHIGSNVSVTARQLGSSGMLQHASGGGRVGSNEFTDGHTSGPNTQSLTTVRLSKDSRVTPTSMENSNRVTPISKENSNRATPISMENSNRVMPMLAPGPAPVPGPVPDIEHVSPRPAHWAPQDSSLLLLEPVHSPAEAESYLGVGTDQHVRVLREVVVNNPSIHNALSLKASEILAGLTCEGSIACGSEEGGSQQASCSVSCSYLFDPTSGSLQPCLLLHVPHAWSRDHGLCQSQSPFQLNPEVHSKSSAEKLQTLPSIKEHSNVNRAAKLSRQSVLANPRSDSVLEAIPVMATVMDLQGQQILFQNKASCMYWGDLLLDKFFQNNARSASSVLMELFKGRENDLASLLNDLAAGRSWKGVVRHTPIKGSVPAAAGFSFNWPTGVPGVARPPSNAAVDAQVREGSLSSHPSLSIPTFPGNVTSAFALQGLSPLHQRNNSGHLSSRPRALSSMSTSHSSAGHGSSGQVSGRPSLTDNPGPLMSIGPGGRYLSQPEYGEPPELGAASSPYHSLRLGSYSNCGSSSASAANQDFSVSDIQAIQSTGLTYRPSNRVMSMVLARDKHRSSADPLNPLPRSSSFIGLGRDSRGNVAMDTYGPTSSARLSQLLSFVVKDNITDAYSSYDPTNAAWNTEARGSWKAEERSSLRTLCSSPEKGIEASIAEVQSSFQHQLKKCAANHEPVRQRSETYSHDPEPRPPGSTVVSPDRPLGSKSSGAPETSPSRPQNLIAAAGLPAAAAAQGTDLGLISPGTDPGLDWTRSQVSTMMDEMKVAYMVSELVSRSPVKSSPDQNPKTSLLEDMKVEHRASTPAVRNAMKSSPEKPNPSASMPPLAPRFGRLSGKHLSEPPVETSAGPPEPEWTRPRQPSPQISYDNNVISPRPKPHSSSGLYTSMPRLSPYSPGPESSLQVQEWLSRRSLGAASLTQIAANGCRSVSSPRLNLKPVPGNKPDALAEDFTRQSDADWSRLSVMSPQMSHNKQNLGSSPCLDASSGMTGPDFAGPRSTSHVQEWLSRRFVGTNLSFTQQDINGLSAISPRFLVAGSRPYVVSAPSVAVSSTSMVGGKPRHASWNCGVSGPSPASGLLTTSKPSVTSNPSMTSDTSSADPLSVPHVTSLNDQSAGAASVSGRLSSSATDPEMRQPLRGKYADLRAPGHSIPAGPSSITSEPISDVSGTLCNWHEVQAIPIFDPVLGTTSMLLLQTDVTVRAELEKSLADLTEAQCDALGSMFPRHILEHMVSADDPNFNVSTLACNHEGVTIMFMDVANFTAMSKEVSPEAVLGYLNTLFTLLDNMVERHGVYKVDTAGDCYIVAGGLMAQGEDGVLALDDNPDPVLGARQVMCFVEEFMQSVSSVSYPHTWEPTRVRVGIHTGSCVSGVVGTKNRKFSLWGDTMNTASRMESTSRVDTVQVSGETLSLLEDRQKVLFQPTGGVKVKGKGIMQTHFWNVIGDCPTSMTSNVVQDSTELPILNLMGRAGMSIQRSPSDNDLIKLGEGENIPISNSPD